MNSYALKAKLEGAIIEENQKNITSLRGRLIQEYKKEIKDLLAKEDLTEEEVETLSRLKEELNTEVEKHKVQLSSRYNDEFINKKAKITSMFTLLPNAVKLSVEKVKVCMNEVKEAKDGKEKVEKRTELLKSVGMLTATPIIYLGKFALDQWYAVAGIGAYLYYSKNPAKLAEHLGKTANFLGLGELAPKVPGL